MNHAILTSYFSKKRHPNDPNDKWVVGRNSAGFIDADSFSYIEPWYNSVHKLGLTGFVFHDNLSEEFLKKYTTDKINFVKVSPSDYSNNDWRFFCYRNFLEENIFDAVFLTDGSDVTVVQDPTQILQERSEDLFVCRDSILLSEFPYLGVHQKFGWKNFAYFAMCQTRLPLINMGVIGGYYAEIMEFLHAFCETRLRMGEPEFNADMWVGQYVFRELLQKNLLIGEPFTSEFKGYQNDRKDVYFIHK